MRSLNATKKGLVTGGVMIALSLIFYYVFKLSIDSPAQYVLYIIYSLGIAWSLLDFAMTAKPATKFAEYFSIGFRTFVVVTLLITVYTFIFYSIHTEIRDAQIEMNNKLLIAQGTHTAPEIEENAKQVKAIFIPGKLAGTSFLYIFLGAAITALYTSMIMKKKKR